MIPTSVDIVQTANLLEQVVAQAVVRPTGSPGLNGISGFLFDIVSREDVHFDSEITDHYVEDNTAIQDHIALRPERFTVKGYAGELTDIYPKGVKLATSIVEKVAVLSTMAPQFAAQAEQLYSQLSARKASISEILNTATSVYDLFVQASTTATRQQAAFNYFYSLWLARTLCTIETPWNVFTDMAIDKVYGAQSEDTRLVSEFSVTFKKIRKVNAAVSVGLSATRYAGRAADLMATVVSQGVVTGKQTLPSVVIGTGALKKG